MERHLDPATPCDKCGAVPAEYYCVNKSAKERGVSVNHNPLSLCAKCGVFNPVTKDGHADAELKPGISKEFGASTDLSAYEVKNREVI